MLHQPRRIPADLGRTDAVRLIALDVDGTILTPDHRITSPTSTAIAAARAAGITVALASSRGPSGLRPILDELGLDDQWFIAYQGALVARWKSDSELEALSETRLDADTARRIEDAAAGRFSVSRYTADRWQVAAIDEAIRREADITGERPIVRGPQNRFADEAPHKVLLIAGDEERTAELQDFAAGLPPTVTAAFSHRNYLEITAAGVDKSAGLVPLAEHLSVPLADIAAIGDGLNDLALFAVVGTSIAMGHAADPVRRAARFVTAGNTQDGAALAISALLPGGSAAGRPS